MFSYPMRLVGFALIACLMASGPAWAQSLTGNVGSAGVTENEQSFEARIGFDDSANLAGRVHYDFAPTGWYSLRIIGAFSQPDEGDWDFTGLTLENWLQWSEEASDDSGFNGGLRFAYTFANDGGPDEAEIRLTLTDALAGGWEWRANVIGEIEAGDGSAGGISTEVRGQLSRSLNVTALQTSDWRLGVEVFSEFGNSRSIPDFDEQAHQIGPVLKISWDNGVYIQTAVRVGLTDGSDGAMSKLFIGREF